MKKQLIMLFLLVAGTAFAQSKIKKANRYFQDADYTHASALYDAYLAKTPDASVEVLKQAGDAYYFMGDARQALKHYQRVYDLQGHSISPTYLFRYIESLKGVTDYAQAKNLTKAYLAEKGSTKDIERYTTQQRQLDSLESAENQYAIRMLASNTLNADFGAAFWGDKVLFASSRDTLGNGKSNDKRSAQPFLKLYIADRNVQNGELFAIQPLKIKKQSDYHEANVAFSPDGKTIYYTVSSQKKKRLVFDEVFRNHFQIVVAQIDELGVVSEAKPLFFNNNGYSTGHPAVSSCGKWLFFTSDMPGGFGGTDLYRIAIGENNTLGTPVNLGPTINTVGNEMFPYFADDKLYFSSNGHFGYGGLDIYQAQMQNGEFTKAPLNLGKPVNSHRDDFGYVEHVDGKFGYLSTNRVEGKSDDIYAFTKKEIRFEQYLEGTVIEHPSKKALAQAKVIARNEFGDVVAETLTDENGAFKLTVPKSNGLTVSVEKTKFSKDEKNVEVVPVNRHAYPKMAFEMANYAALVSASNGVEKITVNPIYFAYNEATITPEGQNELDKVVLFMKKFPEVKIKIESHTDSRGKDAYNLKLSDLRAKSTMAYLVANQIGAERIVSAIGYGETRLINACKNGVKCSEEAHLANRRSDFIILNN